MNVRSDITALLTAAGCTGIITTDRTGAPMMEHNRGLCLIHKPEEPSMRYILGDKNSSYHRVQVQFPGTSLKVNVGENFVEWGNDAAGMAGCDIQLLPDGGFLCRFQESSRHLIVDSKGVRVYDSDDTDDRYLLFDASHADFIAGVPPGLFSFYEGSHIHACTYAGAIQEASGLTSVDHENSEYDRGMFELIARMYGIEDIDTADRADQVEQDIRRHQA